MHRSSALYVAWNWLSYRINNINLPMCHKTRDLGILIDCEINFKEHIYNITASANQRAFFIKKKFPVEGYFIAC